MARDGQIQQLPSAATDRQEKQLRRAEEQDTNRRVLQTTGLIVHRQACSFDLKAQLAGIAKRRATENRK